MHFALLMARIYREGSNGLVEKHCSRALALTPCGPGIDLEKAEGEISLELQDSAQEAVVSCANMAVLQHNTIDLKTDNVAVVTLTVTSKPLLMPTGAEQNCVPKGPEEERASVQMSSIPSGEKHTSATIGPAAPQTELPNTVRPEPKVEVAADRIAVPFVESVRANIVKDGSPVAGEQTCRSNWQDALYPEPIMAVSSLGPCHVAMSPLSALGTVEPQENKALFMVAESGTDTDDFERLASDLIANIISAALAVACRDKAEGMGRPLEACSSIPVSNRQPCVVQEGMKNTGLMPVETLHLPCEEHYTASFAEAATSENTPMEAQPQEGATELNHCLPSPAWRVPEKDYSRKTVENGQKGDCPTHVQEVVPLCLANLQMEEPVAQVEDSGCRTCRLEDRFVSKEVLHSTGLACMVLDGKEDLTGLSGDCRWVSKRMDPRPALHEKTLTDSGLQNGSHMTKLIADQSSGFDVNGHHGLGGQATQPQTSKLVTLYVEIPKYLVGQLIGKQGKYIHFLKQSFGVKIHIFSLPYTQEFQICHIDGTQEQVDKVLTVISQKFTDLDLTKLYSPPTQPISLPSLPMTPWQQTPLTSDTLHSLNQQMSLCYSQPGAPGLTFPVKVGVICAAPASGGAWWRAQVIGHCEDSNEVEIQYLDYGGYNHAKFDTLRQIRSDFLKLPFQGTEVSLDHLAPLPGSNVNRMDSVDRNCKLKIGDRHHSLRGQATHPQTSELIIWEVNVPKHLVGRLIGKQGKYVRFLKQSFGVKIHIFSLPYTMKVQICHIEGTQQQVNKVLAVIAQKFKELDLTNLYTPPSPLPIILPSLPIMAWLMPPSNVTVDVIVVNILSARHIFVQQHTHPTNHVLRTLDQQMSLCYSQPGAPALAFPVEGLLCAAPAVDGAWRRARIYANYKDSNEVLIRYLDYGGYCRVMLNTLRQIRADFIALPFQGIEVLLDNVAPLPGTDGFSAEANAALEEITRGVTLLAQVTSYNNDTGLPLIQMWNMVGNELVSVNCTLVERGLATWVNGS